MEVNYSDIVKLSTGQIGKIVLISEVKTLTIASEPEQVKKYHVLMANGKTKTVTIDDIVKVLSLVERIIILIKGIFKKTPSV